MLTLDDFFITDSGMDALIVVAALVATVTFAAAFTMPGGYQER